MCAYKGTVRSDKGIEKDWGLILAVYRVAGAGIHDLDVLVKRYMDACERGNVLQADTVKKEIEKKLLIAAIGKARYKQWVSTGTC